MPIEILDIILIGMMLLSGLLAMIRGFSREVLSISSWAVAGIAAFLFYKTLAPTVAGFMKSLTENELAIKPTSLSHTDAASLPLAGLTAWQAMITKGKLKQGDKVLIHAGSGGVGTFAIQIAKHFGAYVATTTSAKNAELVKRLGADMVIDYKTEKFQEKLCDYDLVFDMLGGDALVTHELRLETKGTGELGDGAGARLVVGVAARATPREEALG